MVDLTPSEFTSLRRNLTFTPRNLDFGTSGRRGDVNDLSQLEVFINARAELAYLQSLAPTLGGIRPRANFYYAYDLRPSSTRFVSEQGGRGELAQAIEAAICDAGLVPVNLGSLPTPALTVYALARGCGSMMITGSHIPFARNGYKTNSAQGELLKSDETAIAEYVAQWRARLYETPLRLSAFGPDGLFKDGHRECARIDDAGTRAYMARFVDFFAAGCLRGLRVLVYQHSAVGRDLLVAILSALGAEVDAVGRSDSFVPLDTEAIDTASLERIRLLAADASAGGQRYDVLVSTDGDSDRPLLIGLEYDTSGRCTARFFGGDLIGMVVAKYLRADAVVVPISCNDAIDRGELAALLEPKTRIGSPYVIAGINAARARGAQRICGWEANGGFLTGSDIEIDQRLLPALPTRDAFLPILCVLSQMVRTKSTISQLFDALPRRFSRAALLRDFPRAKSARIVAALTATAEMSEQRSAREEITQRIAQFFSSAEGFASVARIDYTDGVRIYFDNDEVAHVRPSGNADELRIYAVANSQQRADAIAAVGVAEPGGILRRLAQAFAGTD